MNQRKIALDIIYKTIADKSYANLLLRSRLREVDPIQRPSITNLVNSVLKKYHYLEYQVSNLVDDKTSLRNMIILAMAVYERFFLNEKDYAVNNEYVELADNKYDRAFINAVLRKVTSLKVPEDGYIKHSLPEWLYKLLERQYRDELPKILDNYERVSEVCYRINHQKAVKEDLEGVIWKNEDVFIKKDGLLNTDWLDKGLAYIQDFNSASLYRHLDLNKDDVILDVCSAPGSKLFNCLDSIDPHNAYANDLHEHRVKLIRDRAEILGFKGINYFCGDGRELKYKLGVKFDKIMLDAPCSGLGTIGRRPDLKFHITPESLDELEVLQGQLLDGVKDLLKEGGILLYCTCTLNKKENRRQIDGFLGNNENYELVEDDTIINDEGDCFYYAKILKGYNE